MDFPLKAKDLLLIISQKILGFSEHVVRVRHVIPKNGRRNSTTYIFCRSRLGLVDSGTQTPGEWKSFELKSFRLNRVFIDSSVTMRSILLHEFPINTYIHCDPIKTR